MFPQDDYSKENLADLIFEALRSISNQHKESVINHNANLRKKIVKQTLAKCKALMPNGTDEQWRDGINFLQKK